MRSLLGRCVPAVFLVVFSGAVGTSGRITYVDDDAPAPGDGASWATAYKYLQDALMTASDGDEVRVAQGVYRPDQFVLSDRPGLGRLETFELRDHVAIRGGYAGIGSPDPNARDIDAYETILSGDLDGNDVGVADPCDLLTEAGRAENCYHVVTASHTNAGAVLDGLTITAGNADGDIEGTGDGGGLLIHYGQPTVVRCTFRENSAGEGGGVYNHADQSVECTAVLTDCVFTRNAATFVGGGMYTDYSDPILTRCTFNNNCTTGDNGRWGLGGAMGNRGCDAIITDCVFTENAGRSGGAISNRDWSRPVLVRCTFSGNVAKTGGGAMFSDRSGPRLTDCVFRGNSALSEGTYYGGGAMVAVSDSFPVLTRCVFAGNRALRGAALYSDSDSRASLTGCTATGNVAGTGNAAVQIYESRLVFANCILWANTPAQILARDNYPTITYSDIQGGWLGEGNIDTDPCFADAGHWDLNGTPDDANDDIWVDGDYHLKSQGGRYDTGSGSWVFDDVTSLCIDAGDPMSPMGPEPFPNGGVVNMGAYGGTAEASKSYFGKAPCETIVAGDVNGDCVVDFRDLCIMGLHWGEGR